MSIEVFVNMYKKGNAFAIGLLIIGLIIFFIVIAKNNVVNLPRISNSCPEGIVPDRILMFNNGGGMYSCDVKTYSNGNPIYGKDGGCISTWADGTKFGVMFCNLGSKEGQNTNYIYCKGREDNLHIYSNTPVDENGNIGEKIELDIRLVLDSKDVNENGTKVVEYSCV